ncbi:hypothetical protein ABIQ69_11275 [Agromyces sp. G08B096]|uniref:Uncharacterized protein n=1 Tax=Agromyces sp. G08B096 TaxID=3156399 RepID=A0AAU7W3C3_9MICO
MDHEQQAEERALALEEERLRLSRLTLRDRLQAIARADDGVRAIRVQLRGGLAIGVRPMSFGRDWLSGELTGWPAAGRCVLPLDAVVAVVPDRDQLSASLQPGPETSAALADRISLPFALRDLSRRRTPLTLVTDDGQLHGTLDRVARDHVDLALHEPGTPRREHEVQGYRIIALERLRLVAFG